MLLLQQILSDNKLSLICFTSAAIACLVFLFAVPGCPVRVDPPTESVCGSRANCGLCASEAVCIWCPGAGEHGRCLGHSTTSCDIETIISVPDLCE